MPNAEALIAARRARADLTHQRAQQALKTMIRNREPLSFAAVANRANVSREFLYRTPELAEKIRVARTSHQGVMIGTVSTEPSLLCAATCAVWKSPTKRAEPCARSSRNCDTSSRLHLAGYSMTKPPRPSNATIRPTRRPWQGGPRFERISDRALHVQRGR